MKKFLILSVTLLFSLIGFSQDNNSRAVALYVQAEESLGNKEYSKAVDEINQALHLLNAPNSKILFIKIKSLEPIYPTKYDYTIDLDSSLKTFFRITDKTTYPEEKYFDILKVNDQLQLFKQSDKNFYEQVNQQYNKSKVKQYPEIKNTINNYLLSNPNSYFASGLNKIMDKINQFNTSKSNRNERKSYLKNAHTFTLITIAYGTPLGTQKEEFKGVKTGADIESLFNGKDYEVGSKYQLRVGLFDKAFSLYTNSVLQLGINWNFVDGEYITWDWSKNNIFTKNVGSNSDFIKTINILRLGTKIGPYLSTSLAKALRLDFYYNVRPGMYLFLDPKEFNYRLVYQNNTFEDFQIKPAIKFSDLSICHEFGLKLKYNRLVINPYYTIGKYTFGSTLTNLSDNTAIRSSYKAKIGYGFVGIGVGIGL